MDRTSASGVIWVLTYTALVLVIGTIMAGEDFKPGYIVTVSIVILPFIAMIPDWLVTSFVDRRD